MNLNEMSNKDLRIKAAELVGFTDIRPRLIPVPWLMDLVEEELSGYLDGKLQCIPDYPYDIAAAMGLWSLLTIKEPRNWAIFSEGDNIAIEHFQPTHPTYQRWENIGDFRITGSAALVITQAFVFSKILNDIVLIKTQGEEK